MQFLFQLHHFYIHSATAGRHTRNQTHMTVASQWRSVFTFIALVELVLPYRKYFTLLNLYIVLWKCLGKACLLFTVNMQGHSKTSVANFILTLDLVTFPTSLESSVQKHIATNQATFWMNLIFHSVGKCRHYCPTSMAIWTIENQGLEPLFYKLNLLIHLSVLNSVAT